MVRHARQLAPLPLPDDVLIMIAFELKQADFEGLIMMSQASWRTRLLCLPPLFECSYTRNTSESGFQIPPVQVRPYVRCARVPTFSLSMANNLRGD